ncbi:hypothetical protein [Catenulispora subtropica]|uniref:hypothetical protein n=1 Tax=Catenulispora subtropica TaxID=450798 RepID=UPI0031D1617E
MVAIAVNALVRIPTISLMLVFFVSCSHRTPSMAANPITASLTQIANKPATVRAFSTPFSLSFIKSLTSARGIIGGLFCLQNALGAHIRLCSSMPWTRLPCR